MPRKSRKASSQKSPLQFLEPSLGGARLHDVPEVRAALNPRSFTTETQIQNNAALTSWVSPQFDQSHIPAPPLKRGRRKCQSITGILDRSNQLSRKSKIPSLSFKQSRTRDQSTATECRSVAGPGCQQQQVNKTSSHRNTQETDSLNGQVSSLRTRSARGTGLRDGAPSSSGRPARLGARGVGRPKIPAPSGSTPPAGEPRTPNASAAFAPPDVDTPDVLPEGGGCRPSSPFIHLLFPQLSQPPTPPLPADVLVVDTPERDYGVKVTWRRRRGVMTLLKGKGHLSDAATLISS